MPLVGPNINITGNIVVSIGYIAFHSSSSSTSWKSVDLLILTLSLRLRKRRRDFWDCQRSFHLLGGLEPCRLPSSEIFRSMFSSFRLKWSYYCPLRCPLHIILSSIPHCFLMPVFLTLPLLVFPTIIFSVFISATLSMRFVLLVSSRTSMPYDMIGLIQVL